MLLYLSFFLFYEALLEGETYLLSLLFSSLSIFSLTYLLFRLKVFGGADAKALNVIGILVPIYPLFEFQGITFPLLGTPPIGLFSLTVLGNAFLATVIVPFGVFCYNLIHFSADMLKKPLYMVFAYRIKFKDLEKLLEKGRHIRLAERLELSNGQLNHFLVCRGITINPDTICQLEEYDENRFLDNLIW
jgi:preflagellin peptidase FlaK